MTGLALDDAGDVLIAGSFHGAVDFGDGVLMSSGSTQSGDLFVAKYAPSGAPRWSKRYGGLVNPAAVATDGVGSVVVGLGVTGLVDFGGGPLPGSAMNHDIALFELAANGGYVWSKRWVPVPSGMSTAWAYATAVKVAANGDVFLLASLLNGTVDVGCGALSPPASGFPLVGLVAKLTSTGACVWSKPLAGVQVDLPVLGIDASGDVYFAGDFDGPADFGGGQIGDVFSDETYVFLTKLDPGGNHLFTQFEPTGHSGNDYVSMSGLAVDAAGDVVVTGTFGPASINEPPGEINLGGVGFNTGFSSSSFVIKLDPDGMALWGKGFVSAVTTGTGVAVDPSGGVAATGSINGSVDFGTGTLTGDGIYLARYDATGAPLSAKVYPTSSQGPLVAVDGLSNAVLAGDLKGGLDLGTGMMTSAGADDVFLADVGP